MNSFNRLSKIFNGELPDRPPLFDLLRNDAAISYYTNLDPLSHKIEDVVYNAIGVALDSTKQFIRIPQEERIEILPDGRKRTHFRWTYWTEPFKFDSVDDAAMYLKKILDNPEKFIGDPVSYVRAAEEDYDRKKEAIGDISLLLEMDGTEGFHGLYEILGMETLCFLSVDYPDLIGQYLDLGAQRSIMWIEELKIADKLPGVFYGVDLAQKTGTIFSPKFLRKVVFPRMERVMSAYISKGIPVVYHSDGNLWSILDDLVSMGISALNPIEILAGMNLNELRTKYPDLIFIGGIDCSQLLPYATPEEVSAEVIRAIEAAGPKYVVGSSTEIHDAIPLDNVKAMIDTVMEHQY